MIAIFALTLLAATKKTTSSSSATFLIFVVIIVAALYFLFLRPQQQRARKQREQTSAIQVDDEILTVGGIVGRVVEVHDDRLVIVSGGVGEQAGTGELTRITVMRSAVSRKLVPSTGSDIDDIDAKYDDDDEEPDEDEHDQTDASDTLPSGGPPVNGTEEESAT